MAVLAPANTRRISTPATAMGSSPAALSTENRPLTSGGMEKVSHPSSFAICRSAPCTGSVTATMRPRAPSVPYFRSSRQRRARVAMAVSVAVPDLETMAMEKSRSSRMRHSSFHCRVLRLLPA